MEEELSSPALRAAERDVRLRVLLFSDLHLDRAYEWAPPGIGEARRAAAREALIAILGDARRQGVDAIACAGDLFNRRTVSPANMQWLAAAFRSASVPVLIAPGNDDFIGPLGGYTSHDWPENVTVFDSDRFSPVDVDGVTIWGPHIRLRTDPDRFWTDSKSTAAA